MKDRNRNRPGYKKTKVGWIPEEWEAVRLGDICTQFKAGVSVNSEDRPASFGEKGVLKTSCVSTGVFRPEENKVVLKEEIIRLSTPVRAETVIISRMNTVALVGANAFVLKNHETLYLPDRLWQTEIQDRKKDLPLWFGYVMGSPLVRHLISARATGTSGSMKNVTKTAVRSIHIPRPVLPEQKGIADVLECWDKVIRCYEKKIEKKKNIKKGLMQRLLSGKQRLPGFEGEWKEVRCKEFARLTAGGTPSTSHDEYWGGGIPWMSSGELNLRRITDVIGRITEAGLKNSSTKWIPEHSVLIGLAGQGKTRATVAINEIRLCTNQSVAAIIPDVSYVDYQYLFYHLDRRYSELRRLSTGDSGRGGLNLALLGNLRILLPPIIEQRAIASVLSSADAEISILERKLASLKDQKRFLLKNLVTGSIRLPEFCRNKVVK